MSTPQSSRLEKGQTQNIKRNYRMLEAAFCRKNIANFINHTLRPFRHSGPLQIKSGKIKQTANLLP